MFKIFFRDYSSCVAYSLQDDNWYNKNKTVEFNVRDDELETIINDLLEVYGYDFTNYARASLKRRVDRLFSIGKFPSFAEFRYKIKTDINYFRKAVEELSVTVTEMFRDPSFYKSLRSDILPVLATHPFIRIWHAGCSSGEEIYSMAILLNEHNLLHKSLIYATDINPGILEKARQGIYSLRCMKQHSENYILAGGQDDFSTYYSAKYDHAKIDETLRSKMIFSTHNLVSDGSFNEFHLIVCRNVLIYFDKELQNKVYTLFDESLAQFGFLALGSKETLNYFSSSDRYRQLNNKEKIWRKIA